MFYVAYKNTLQDIVNPNFSSFLPVFVHNNNNNNANETKGACEPVYGDITATH